MTWVLAGFIRALGLKYHEAVAGFTSLDDRAESACIDLLLALASEAISRVLYYDPNGCRPDRGRSPVHLLYPPPQPA